MNMKWAMVPPLFLLSLGNTSTTIYNLMKEDYSDVAFTGIMGFLFFHFGLTVLRYGVQPWRVVPGICLLAGTYAAWSISFFADGNWQDGLIQALGAVVWCFSAKKANDARRRKELEARAKDL